MITDQLVVYNEALSDVEDYVNAAMALENNVEPDPTAFKSDIYRELFEELKSPV